ncbi:hypothetical protein MIND_00524300 [Mycena indigotica]|uniref:Uncharacterized protein n=1 Tax=Mycena indigotica TaxID=2126181 RepID=A0A8H6WCF2_9AGAR|nr:uncharacterized protein MIND_00523900 [Mycena indigotica]XP_037222322.1 uncharacterized protein MIND_00524300 [Mycena indigotica]KAF7307299.1 hypothetical protein MIND_00523900 [Mycena indigotica]KAF7307303.1 hypothetical protein MIND_00524300 [Mycena indigotica]
MPRQTGVSSKSEYGFPHVLAACPGLFNLEGKTRATYIPRHRIGWLLNYVEIRAATPEDKWWATGPTKLFLKKVIRECCAKHGVQATDIGVLPLGDIGYDLKCRDLLGLVFIHFANNLTNESLAVAANEALLDDLAALLQVPKQDAVWLLQDSAL